jgi:hypothetical protein
MRALLCNQHQHTDACATLIGGLGRSIMMASSTACSGETSCRLAALTMSDNGRPRPSTRKWRLLPFFSLIRRVGANALLCQWRLHHCPVDALPSPGDTIKLVVLGKPRFAQGLKDARFLPFQKARVDCTCAAIEQLFFCKFRELVLGCCADAPNQGFMVR